MREKRKLLEEFTGWANVLYETLGENSQLFQKTPYATRLPPKFSDHERYTFPKFCRSLPKIVEITMEYFIRHELERSGRLFPRTREKRRVSSLSCTRRHAHLPTRVKRHAYHSPRTKDTRLFLQVCDKTRVREDPHETFLLEAPFGQWRIKTYLFDESIRVIRAADGVHEARHLLHVPQPGIFTAVTALVQEN